MPHRFRLLLVALALALLPTSAFAHGFAVRYDLPLPLGLYLGGAAATVVLSFLLVGFIVGEGSAARDYPRVDLLRFGWFRTLLGGQPFLFGLRMLAVASFCLVIVSGLFGDQAPAFNFAPTFVWIIWWVGLSFCTGLVGNLWALANPWAILFDWADSLARRLGVEGGLELNEPYPRGRGVWPALLLYFTFVWIEVVFEGSPTPFNIALLTGLYSVVTWAGMAWYGRETWLQRGEAFSVFFGVLARFAPTEVRVDDPPTCRACAVCRGARECVNCYACFRRAAQTARRLNLRPWAVGLLVPERLVPGQLTFVMFMLAGVTFDGLAVTPFWDQIGTFLLPLHQAAGPLIFFSQQTFGLMVLPALFLAVYVAASFLTRVVGRIPARTDAVAASFVFSLVPIALAYQLAHYYTLLLISGQSIIPLVSDPLGWGWDLFGTASYVINTGIVSPEFVWYSQIGAIVSGHAVAVYLAHCIALRLLGDRRSARRSQYPLLVLMVLYTISSLWILSQPVVQENEVAEQPLHAADQPIGRGEVSPWSSRVLDQLPIHAAPP